MLWCLSRWLPGPLSGRFLTHRDFSLAPPRGDSLQSCWISRGYRAAKEITSVKSDTVQNISCKVHDWTVGQEPPPPPLLRPIVERHEFHCHGRSDSSATLFWISLLQPFSLHPLPVTSWSTVLLQELNRCSAVNKNPTRCNSMQIYIYCKITTCFGCHNTHNQEY